jgi:hypothetical protein
MSESREYAPTRRPPSWRLRVRRAAGFIAAAAISAIAASLITTQSLRGIADTLAEPFHRDQPAKSMPVRATAELFRQVKTSDAWGGEPRMFEQSQRYIVSHFLDVNPWGPHGQVPPQRPVLPPIRLVTETPVHAGGLVTLVGRVRYLMVGGVAAAYSPSEKNRVYLAQIGEGRGADPLVYCLFSEATGHRLQPGQLAVAIGVPIADGAFSLSDGGFAQGAYMVGMMVRPIRGLADVRRALRLAESEPSVDLTRRSA